MQYIFFALAYLPFFNNNNKIKIKCLKKYSSFHPSASKPANRSFRFDSAFLFYFLSEQRETFFVIHSAERTDRVSFFTYGIAFFSHFFSLSISTHFLLVHVFPSRSSKNYEYNQNSHKLDIHSLNSPQHLLHHQILLGCPW